ncbi:hypothetical protein DQ04_13551000 [Trypanosoma grayi]|uniref:hypothetical protein n=1 Tax=Trypanosoma grayi TaxID=71804 RepID=UPI0004F488B3|nr:hypothetical protein DQ04_13551000 [Trypanosoma grayi]KEG06513.1 hypothetical protein DQ04_13551000 [Trypanosoma grayi]
MSAEQAQLGRRLYYQLRVAQAAKENPGVNIQTLANATGDPRKEDDPVFQAVQKAKKHSAPPSYARCFRCGRAGHYSTTCYAQVKKTPFKPKKRLSDTEAMKSRAGKALKSLPSGSVAAGLPGNGQFSAGGGLHATPRG